MRRVRAFRHEWAGADWRPKPRAYSWLFWCASCMGGDAFDSHREAFSAGCRHEQAHRDRTLTSV